MSEHSAGCARTKRKRNVHHLGNSSLFTPQVIDDIHIKSELGRYRMRGFSMFKKIPLLGRSHLPARHPDPFRHRGIPGEVPDEDGPRAARQASSRARHPDLHHRHELRGAELRGEDRARARRDDGRHRDLLGRGRHDPRRAPLLLEVVLPVHPVPLRLQPASPAPRRRLRILHRPGLQGGAGRSPDGTEGHRPGRGDALPAGPASTSARPRAIPTGSDPTTSRSRCRRCARRRTGRSRSSSSWGRRASTTTCAWRPRPIPTASTWTAWKGAPEPGLISRRRRPAFRGSPRSGRRARRSTTSARAARSRSCTRAASATAATSPRRSRSARMRLQSVIPH